MTKAFNQRLQAIRREITAKFDDVAIVTFDEKARIEITFTRRKTLTCGDMLAIAKVTHFSDIKTSIDKRGLLVVKLAIIEG